MNDNEIYELYCSSITLTNLSQIKEICPTFFIIDTVPLD